MRFTDTASDRNPIIMLLFVIAFALATFVPDKVAAQGYKKYYLSPQVGAGICVGYDHKKALKLDFGFPDRMVHGSIRGGYFVHPRMSLFTGFDFGSYHYHMITAAAGPTPDTIRSQTQHSFEIPLGVRFSTYNGRRSFRTRYYGTLGLAACLLNGARHDYHTAGGGNYGTDVNEAAFNRFYVRAFAEGGLDIPMDFDSAILIGVALSQGLSRNMNEDGALARHNYGVLAASLTLGLRLGL